MSKVTCIWDEPAILGEGPLWVREEQAIYWVDIKNKYVHRLTYPGREHTRWHFDEQVTSLSRRAKGGFVGTIRDGFAAIDFDQKQIQAIQLPEAALPENRFNDGKVDRAGRYWAGSMDASEQAEQGSLYRLSAELDCQLMDGPYAITNGPAFNLRGTTMYHTDSPKQTVYCFDLTSEGTLSNKRVFVQLKQGEGFPDGMTVDAEDCLWVCHFAGARISRFSPAGELLSVLPMPVPNITSCTFGGADMGDLFITTAQLHLSPEQIEQYPQAGCLFVSRPGVKGVAATPFAG